MNIPVSDHSGDSNKIHLVLSSDLKIDDQSACDESYTLSVKPKCDITITAKAPAGIFYGIQSLLSIVDSERSVPQCEASDRPRYSYRGMHMDVSRNFHPMSQMLKLLDVMAMYKMNKFHFHLTDDEGWRLEIPGLEELIEVSSRNHRCPHFSLCRFYLLEQGSN